MMDVTSWLHRKEGASIWGGGTGEPYPETPTETPKVPLLRALWSLLDGLWGVLKGTWRVLEDLTI